MDLEEIANEMLAHLDDEDGVQGLVMLRDGRKTRSQVFGFDMETDPMAPTVWLLTSAMQIARINGKKVVAFKLKGEG